jgi:chromosome segregation ATPase
MISYEQEAFIEVELHAIKSLSRSTATVQFASGGREVFDVHCTLCDYLDGSERCCRVAFYARHLKKSLVFKVNGPDQLSSWRYARDLVSRLGFELEEVNLKLSPVLQDVVLRDVPGFATPAEARKLSDEKQRSMDEYRKIVDNAPSSVQGKKAALKLSSEKHNQERIQELRKILERTLHPLVNATADLEDFAARFKVLEENLAAAEEQAEIERRKREMSESITAAAEKRLQELEKTLVDVETKSAEAIKLKRKNARLQGQVKKLSATLETVEQDLKIEQEKQQQFLEEAEAALRQIAGLKAELQEAAKSLEIVQEQLVKEQSDKARQEESLKSAEKRIRDLELETEDYALKLVLSEENFKKAEDVQAQLAESQQALQKTLGDCTQLREDLARALEERESLARDVREQEAYASDKTEWAAQEKMLMRQNEQLTEELSLLRIEYARECEARQCLEECAEKDKQRINDLHSALAEKAKEVETLALRASAVSDEEVQSLKARLVELKSSRERDVWMQGQVKAELHDARERIDYLEEMLREKSKTAEVSAVEAVSKSDGIPSGELIEKLSSLESQLARERKERDQLASALAATEKLLAEQRDELPRGRTGKGAPQNAESAETSAPDTAAPSKSAKPLPHDLRPAPRKGALFRPDWDLRGLPCQTSAQVAQAWESGFNVQISLEGYPSQYCMAFLVVLQTEMQKSLYMLYRLRQIKHTLVCVPVNIPDDEKSLQKAIAEGLKFLKRSGFDMAEMTLENIDSTLTNYFQKN